MLCGSNNGPGSQLANLKKSPRLWAGFAIPGTIWLIGLFAIPFYAVACVAFGTIDPVFRDAVPQWSPLSWDFTQARQVLTSLATGPLRGVGLRTLVYVFCAMTICFLIGFPIAYFLARHAGKRKMLLLVLIIVPFWVNYLMRMLAWVNLLSVDGLFTRFMGNFGVNYNWLDGSPITVILGLVYGYIPFLILPLFATLDRLDWRLVDAARDLGANSRQAFFLITLPMSKAGLVAAGVLIALPMFGDYYTNDLLSRSPSTEMIGNQIDFFLNASTQPQNGALLVLALSIFLLFLMSFYLRSTRQQSRQVIR